MKHRCKKCKYKWESRKDDPKECPRCKRYDWDNQTTSGMNMIPAPEEKKK